MRPSAFRRGYTKRFSAMLDGVPEAELSQAFEAWIEAEYAPEIKRIDAQLAAAARRPTEAKKHRATRARLAAEIAYLAQELRAEAMLALGDAAAVAERLAVYEAGWRETANPVFVWRALDLVLTPPGGREDKPLPGWCAEYLAGAARRLADLERRLTAKRRRSDKRQRVPNLVVEAMLLTRRGTSAFAAASREDERMEVAWIADFIRSRTGSSVADANEAATRIINVGTERAQRRSVARGRAARSRGKPAG